MFGFTNAVAAAVKLGVAWRVDATDAVDAGAGAGDVATADSAESAAAMGSVVTPTRLVARGLLFSGVGVDDDRSVSAGVPRLDCLPDAVDDVCASTLFRAGVVTASTLADVAAVLDADVFEACLPADELFEVADECTGLLVAGLPADDDDEPEEPASAAATPQPVASATPTPKKTASPPTRPIHTDALFIRPGPNHFSAKIKDSLGEGI